MTMGITVRWHDTTCRSIVVEYDDWNWDAFHAAFQEVDALLKQVQHNVFMIHVIHNYPSGLALPHINKIFINTPQQIGGSAIVLKMASASNSFIKALINIVVQKMGKSDEMVFVPTLDEALTLAEKTL